MLNKLIEEGILLESETDDNGYGSKFFESLNFEKWISKSILYLEKSQSTSVITEKAKENFKTLDTNTNYDYYRFLLGSLQAINEFEKELDPFSL